MLGSYDYDALARWITPGVTELLSSIGTPEVASAQGCERLELPRIPGVFLAPADNFGQRTGELSDLGERRSSVNCEEELVGELGKDGIIVIARIE